MLQATYEFDITYEHIPGVENSLADSLSRMHLHKSYRDKVEQLTYECSIRNVIPCLYIFNAIDTPILSRGGIRVVPVSGGR